MSKILAIDLGKFKSVTCLLDTATNQTEFWTMSTDRPYLLAVLQKYRPDLVVIESCSTSGWVHDTCVAAGYQVLVCNPNQEAWKWKNVKRKTDRDDALKLAKLAAVGQLVPVYIPCARQREYRSLVKYRKVVLGRLNRVQNNIRALFSARGMGMTSGQKAWCSSGGSRSANMANHCRIVPPRNSGVANWSWNWPNISGWASTTSRSIINFASWPPRTSACSCCRRSLASAARRPK